MSPSVLVYFGALGGSGTPVGSNAPTGACAATGLGKGIVIRKNAPNNRSDVGWAHGYSVDGDSRKIKCKYCEKVISGGDYCLKPHLACRQNDVGTYLEVSDKIKK